MWRRTQRLCSLRCSSVFALSSGAPPSAIAIVRISGAESSAALKTVTKNESFEPKVMKFSRFYDENGHLIDQGMAVFFKGPHSFTGEDTVELFLHGSRAVVDAMLDRLGQLPGLTPAAPGDFTKRAFYNGKMNVAQVEALNDLIRAETPAQLGLAHRQAQVARTLDPVREALLNLSAQLEATIDFGEDLENQQQGCWRADLKQNVDALLAKLRRLERNARRGMLVREGVRVALVGRTNVGKSSLLNRLAERDVAIVSDVPGTTRDALELRVRLAGLNATLYDTAGFRSTHDPLEVEGIRRSTQRMNESQLIVAVLSPCASSAHPCDQLQRDLHDLKQTFPKDANVLVLINKVDLLQPDDVAQVKQAFGSETYLISCKTGAGLQSLLNQLENRVQQLQGAEQDEMVLSRERHVHLLGNAIYALVDFPALLDADWAMAAQALRDCASSVGEITGAIVNESVLDKLFSTFCVGK